MQKLCRCGFKTCILYHSTVGLKVVVLFTNTRKKLIDPTVQKQNFKIKFLFDILSLAHPSN